MLEIIFAGVDYFNEQEHVCYGSNEGAQFLPLLFCSSLTEHGNPSLFQKHINSKLQIPENWLG